MAFTPSTLQVFALKDPRDGTIGYIGRSSDPQAYLDQLVGSSRKGWIGELSSAGKKPQLVILEKTNSEDGAAVEKKWRINTASWGN